MIRNVQTLPTVRSSEEDLPRIPRCRSCATELGAALIDLGMQPLANAYRRADQLHTMEAFYPLRVRLCQACGLVQADMVTTRETIFHAGYAYFSSFSDAWLAHSRTYAQRMQADLGLDASSFIVEIASNDGYLLRWFAQAGVRVRGIDPAADCAKVAEGHGVPTTIAFFGRDVAATLVEREGQAQLVIANNVLAHVPDLNDFVAGIATVLAPTGIATFEFPHALELVKQCAYDTVYHEHYCYLSVQALQPLFARHGLHIIDIEQLPTHGGSLRLFVRHANVGVVTARVAQIVTLEEAAALDQPETYMRLMDAIDTTRIELFSTLLEARRRGELVAAYGAAAKGNTLLNTLGMTSRMISFVVDRNPQKIGRFLPGSQIPILHCDELMRRKPSFILVLPWNWADEISSQLAYTRQWGAKLYRAIPRIQEIPAA